MLLLALFVLPSALPLFALGTPDDARLPACCRRDGKHHCAMRLNAEGTGLDLAAKKLEPVFRAPAEACPYAPQAVVSLHAGWLGYAPQQTSVMLLASHPAGVAQTECKLRIARDRAREKRGPPHVTFS